MKVSRFLEGRVVERQAVLKYMQRHPELFNGHIKKEGKEYQLDAAAVRMLEEKYPLPEPVQVIKGIDPAEYQRVQDERAEALQRLADVQSRENALQARISEAEGKYNALLLQSKLDQEKAVEDAVKAKEDEMSLAQKAEIRILKEHFTEELKSKQAELEIEKGRKLSWKERIFGKKEG